MNYLLKILILASFISSPLILSANQNKISELKSQILTLAKSYEGQGDPDYSRQNSLNVLVNQLLEVSPQSPISSRLPILAGTWKQVWGPYDYRNNDRGIDPELGIEEIYQVVNSKGYYYNVSYLYKNGDKSQKRIGLLRGEYKLEKSTKDNLTVKFTEYPGTLTKPEGLEIWQLAEMAETNTLPNRISIVPSWVVKLFFGGGQLQEVYTDDDLRITYGFSKKYPNDPSIYIMTRVQ